MKTRSRLRGRRDLAISAPRLMEMLGSTGGALVGLTQGAERLFARKKARTEHPDPQIL